jgi:lipopolysaccharide transport system permease protein
MQASATNSGAAVAPPTIHIRATHGLAALQLGEVWTFRELLYFLVWRDVKVRYKQTSLGIAWIVLQPLITLALFYLIFGVLFGQRNTNQVPYPAFAFVALIPWTYFSGALTRAATSLVDGAQLISKVYFPRVLVPLSAVLAGLVDFAVACLPMIALLLFYKIVPTWRVLVLPLLLLLATITALGFSLWLAALNVSYRDIKHIVPFLAQTWLYATPVMYATNLLPAQWRFVLALNPMTAVVEGFRWALLGDLYAGAQLDPLVYALGIGIALLVCISGLFFFRATERTFADVV